MFRLEKYLSECGIGSRKEIKNHIKNGLIKVNNAKIKSGKLKIKDDDLVEFRGERLIYEKYRYYLMHKPSGVITAVKDDDQKTIFDILPKWVNKKDLFPVGRLDKDTEGIILLTNDGEYAHNCLSPKKHIDKKYYVILKNSISDSDIKRLAQGIEIEKDKFTQPAKVEQIDSYKIYLTIQEGKYHQVKRMMKKVDNEVVYLKRVSFGKFSLGNLEKGEIKKIKV